MLKEIEKEINDMLTGIEKVDNDKSNEIGYHHRIEWKVGLIEKCLAKIHHWQQYDKLDKEE